MACSEDALIDNPTRERGQWLGDVGIVGMEIGAAGFSDIAIVRRGLVQSAQCANAEGLVAGLCPGGESYMASYALQWVPACLNYMRLTGDRTLLNELYDAAERNIAAFDPYMTEEGITSCPYWNFIDWGYVPNEGNSDMALNLHYMIAVQTMARWADLMDRPDRAEFYRERAEQFGKILETYYAQNEYEAVRSESRRGFAISSEELKRIDSIISPLIKQGQSIHQICVNNVDLIMLDEKTIYNYIDAGLLSVCNGDLPRKVRYRIRKKKKPVRVDKKCHVGRTYEDFQEYMAANPDVSVVEMDSVEGRKGGKVFLTIFFQNCNLMLAFIRDANTARSVTDIFNQLYVLLGHEKFTELFPVIVTDRGSEFTDPLGIEFNGNDERRTRVFYCDPQRSDQKGGCEVCHEMIRRILPKKSSFDNLIQEDVSLLMSHINSYTRKKLNDQSANQLFSFLYGRDTLTKLEIKEIPANEINLTPYLLKK